MRRTPLTSQRSLIVIFGFLLLLSCLVTPTHAEDGTGNLFEPETDDIIGQETNIEDSHNITDIFNSTSIIPTNAPSSSSNLPLEAEPKPSIRPNSNTKTPQDYRISPVSKCLVFVFGAAVICSVLLLIKNNREHSAQLAQFRRSQQERREREQSRREEALVDRRKKRFWQQFYFAVISDDGSNALKAESNVLSAKQGGHSVTTITEDVEAPVSTDNDVDDTKPPTSSTGSHFSNFWNKKQDDAKPECSICLGDYCPGDTICVAKAAKCNHVFHQDCIAEWLKKADCCPLCRVSIMTE